MPILSYAERVYDVQNALSAILPSLMSPAPTRVVAEKLARQLEWPVDDVARILLKLASSHPHATHNGKVSMRFGRTMTGWLWHSEPQEEGVEFRPATSGYQSEGPRDLPKPRPPMSPCSRCELEPSCGNNAGLCASCVRADLARGMALASPSV